LPSGAACNFQPSSAHPTSGNPVGVKLTIATASDSPSGTFPITITGATTGGPAETQNLTLTVTNLADYQLVIAPPTSRSATETAKGAQDTFSGTLTALNGYNSAVNLTCAAGTTAPPPGCTANPASPTPTAGGAAFTVTVKS